MEEANIFTNFSLKPITTHLGKMQSGPASSGRETLRFAGGSTDELKIAKQVCDVLLQEDVALLSAVNPYHTDQVLHLRSLWWAPQAAALVHSLALKHTAFAGEGSACSAFGVDASYSHGSRPYGLLSVLNVTRRFCEYCGLHFRCLFFLHRCSAGAVRLAVLWLSKQLIVGAVHFAEHVLAFLFVDYMRAGYGNAPQSPHVAFLRYACRVGSWCLRLVAVEVWQVLVSESERQKKYRF